MGNVISQILKILGRTQVFSYTMFNISVATPFSSYHRRLYFVILTASAYFILPSISGGLVLSFIIFGILILAFRKL